MKRSEFNDIFTENSNISLYQDRILSKFKKKTNQSLYKLFYGPVSEYENDYIDVLKYIEEESRNGKNHILFQHYQKKYPRGYSENIIIPYLDIYNRSLTDLIILSNPDDCERIAKKHVKKMPNFKPQFYDSVISTTNNEKWRNQRLDLIQAFSPLKLNKIMDISGKRARISSEILWKLSNNGKNKVNMSEFFLNETMAQLQLALFGVSNEFQEKTNKSIRDAFGGKTRGYAREFAFNLLDKIKDSKGPLSEAMNSRVPETETESYGNALILSFAGHDTTGHTLTWLIYELSKNQSFQLKLQREVDKFWKEQKDKKIKTGDFKRLKFMTRCIMETLRLHTAVPNGTFRELIEDDYIMGKDGMVKLHGNLCSNF